MVEGLDSRWLAMITGITAVASSVQYFTSDVLELVAGGYFPSQLALTYAAEAVIPLFVIGLYTFQRPRIAWLGFVGSVLYSYAFVFFTSRVVYALMRTLPDWSALSDRFGAWMTVHSIFMVVAGILIGIAIIRAAVFPRWTGIALIAGMVFMAVATTLPDVVRTLAAGIRDLAFARMGLALLMHGRRVTARHPLAQPETP